MIVRIKDFCEDFTSPQELYDALKGKLSFSRECYDYIFDHVARMYEGRETRIIDFNFLFFECKDKPEMNHIEKYLKNDVYKKEKLRNNNVLYCIYNA